MRQSALTLADNGKGMSAETGGYGLIGLRERAIGGGRAIQSTQGKGFQLVRLG